MRYWLDYDEDFIRKTYWEKKAIEQNKPKFNRHDLYDAGYTDEEIDGNSMLLGE
jgi:hypothetical protein